MIVPVPLVAYGCVSNSTNEVFLDNFDLAYDVPSGRIQSKMIARFKLMYQQVRSNSETKTVLWNRIHSFNLDESPDL